MRTATAVITCVLALAGAIDAQYTLVPAWPSKMALANLQVLSSMPDVLPGGLYTLELQIVEARLIGRLRQGAREYADIPFAVKGCDGVTRPTFEPRAIARRLPPVSGTIEPRVEIQLAEAATAGCAITGVFFTTSPATLPSRPNPGIPDQDPVDGPVDLSIRAAKTVPDDSTQVQIEVYNSGPGSSETTKVRLYYYEINGKVTVGQAPLPFLAPQASVWIAVGAGKPIAAAYSLIVQIDDPDRIEETNEQNNSFKFK